LIITETLRIAVVVPFFNEEKVLNSTIGALFKFKRNCTHTLDFIVVDDGSTDSSVENIDRKYLEELTLLKHDKNRGQGAALSTGLKYVRKHNYDVMIHFDADGQHHPDSIQKLIDPILNESFDVVLGSRFLSNSSIDMIPIKRRVLLKLALKIDNFLSGVEKTDVHNGMRAFGNRAINEIDIKASRMEHASEIIWEIKRANLSFTEVAVDISYTEYSVSKQKPMAYAWITFIKIIIYFFHYKFGKKN